MHNIKRSFILTVEEEQLTLPGNVSRKQLEYLWHHIPLVEPLTLSRDVKKDQIKMVKPSEMRTRAYWGFSWTKKIQAIFNPGQAETPDSHQKLKQCRGCSR